MTKIHRAHRILIDRPAAWRWCALLLTAVALPAQTWEAQRTLHGAQAHEAFQQGDIRRAVSEAEHALFYAEFHTGAHSTTTSESLRQLGRILAFQGKYPRARKLLQRSFLLEIERPKPNPTLVAASAAYAEVLWYRAELSEAERILQTVDSTLLASEETSGEAKANFYLQQGRIATMRERDGSARTAFQHAERMVEVHDVADVVLRSQIQLCFARLHYIYLRLDDAKRHIDQALQILESHRSGTHPELAAVLNLLSLWQSATYSPRTTLTLARRALLVAFEPLGEDHRYVASAQSQLAFGIVERDFADLSAAIILAEDAVRKVARNHDSFHPIIADLTGNLAILTSYGGDDRKARSIFYKSIAIYESFYGPNSLALAVAYTNLGFHGQRNTKHDEAASHWKRALELYHQQGIEGTHTDFTILMGLSELASANKEFTQARAHLAEAEKIADQLLGARSLLHADVEIVRGRLDRQQARQRSALTSLQNSMAIAKEHEERDPKQSRNIFVASALECAMNFEDLRAFPEALDHLTLAREALKGTTNPDHLTAARIERDFGRIYVAQGDDHAARGAFERAVALYEGANLAYRHWMVGSLIQLSDIAVRRNDLQGAYEPLARALGLLDETNLHKEWFLVDVLDRLMDLTPKLGRTEEHERFRKRRSQLN
ncbi:MAG TPA: tetratricopeptide repeat protein [Planctomycetota bacterium]|nr:tetratricopeptide repeat protein [Planctomycetota bacterium]